MALPQQGTETYRPGLMLQEPTNRVNGLTPTGDGNPRPLNSDQRIRHQVLMALPQQGTETVAEATPIFFCSHMC